MLTLFESKNLNLEHSGLKSILGQFDFGKTPGFLKNGHFFCPFLNFSNTFAKQENPKNRYYLQSNLKKPWNKQYLKLLKETYPTVTYAF